MRLALKSYLAVFFRKPFAKAFIDEKQALHASYSMFSVLLSSVNGCIGLWFHAKPMKCVASFARPAYFSLYMWQFPSCLAICIASGKMYSDDSVKQSKSLETSVLPHLKTKSTCELTT